MYTKIIKDFQDDKAVSAAFLDVQSAYDNVLADVLLDKVVQLGISLLTVKFICSLVSKRRCLPFWRF